MMFLAAEGLFLIQEPLTLYKLIILYMLNRVNFPLTKAQIMDFILEREYISFLTLQQVIGELIDNNMVRAESIRNRTHLIITDEGKETLSYFGNRIGESLRAEIDEFFKQNELELRNEVSVKSDYYKATTGEYEARLTASDNGIILVDITLSVPNEETAAAICDNWQKKNQDVYKLLVENLF
jgi:predicted transcriptional regulator